jgi:hypothetical protein
VVADVGKVSRDASVSVSPDGKSIVYSTQPEFATHTLLMIDRLVHEDFCRRKSIHVVNKFHDSLTCSVEHDWQRTRRSGSDGRHGMINVFRNPAIIRRSEFSVPNLEPRTWNPERRTSNTEPRTPNRNEP